MNDLINEAFERVDDILGNCQALTYNAIRKNDFSSIELICYIKDARKAMTEFENTLRAERDRIREKEEAREKEYKIIIDAFDSKASQNVQPLIDYAEKEKILVYPEDLEDFARGWEAAKEHYKIQ